MKKYNLDEREQLEKYLLRIKFRIEKELTKYGFSWKDLVAAFKKSEPEKIELDEQWKSYYAEKSKKPLFLSVYDYPLVFEYQRVKRLLSGFESDSVKETMSFLT